jgi:Lipid II flippase MurJ
VGRGLTAVTLVLMPAVAGLVVAAIPVVALVYGRGSFGPEAAALTATAVAWYAPGLLPLAGGGHPRVLCAGRQPHPGRGGGDGGQPGRRPTLGVALGVPGIAASTVLSLVVAAVATTAQHSRRHGAVDAREVAAALGRLGLAGGGLGRRGGSARGGPGGRGAGTGVGRWDAAVRLVGVGVAVAVTYVVVLVLLRAPEGAMLSGGLRARWRGCGAVNGADDADRGARAPLPEGLSAKALRSTSAGSDRLEVARTVPPKSLMSTIATPVPSADSSRAHRAAASRGWRGGSSRCSNGGRPPSRSRARGRRPGRTGRAPPAVG